MTENKNKKISFVSLLQKMTPKILIAGNLVDGKVIDVERKVLYIDLGAAGTGIVFGREFKEASRIIKKLKPQDRVSAVVVEPENENGFIELSIKEAEAEKTWKELRGKMNESVIIETKILGANKGGLMVEIDGIAGFLPVSQLSPQHYPRINRGEDIQKIASALKEFIGKNFKVKIINLSQDEEKLIVSEKVVRQKEEEAPGNEYKIGDIVEGEVTGVMDFGAFIRLNENIEGLIHISELDWRIINNPGDVIKGGEKIKAKVVDVSNGRISLSIKALKKNPWDSADEKYKKGQEVKGEIVKHNPYGAFVKLDNYIHGLVHISEIKNLTSAGKKMEDVLKIGQKYTFEILSITPKEQRLTLKPIEV